MSKRIFKKFSYKGANFRICSNFTEKIQDQIIQQREQLEKYIYDYPEFKTSLKSLPIDQNSPESALRMYEAANITGIGPMSAVAGTMSQLICEYAVSLGDDDVIVENGGDIFINSKREVALGIYAGENKLSGKLAFKILPSEMPIAVCSSSSKMGHSLSFGNCDLVTVFSPNASLADSVATAVCNRIKSIDEIESILNYAFSNYGVSAIFVIKDNKVAHVGKIPEIIKCDKNITDIITVDENSPDKERIFGISN